MCCVSGQLIHERTLPYTPGVRVAVTCFPGGIVLTEKDQPSVHIHAWSGEKVCTLERDALELEERDRVHAVGMCGETLVIAAGDKITVRTLRTYKVSCSQSSHQA